MSLSASACVSGRSFVCVEAASAPHSQIIGTNRRYAIDSGGEAEEPVECNPGTNQSLRILNVLRRNCLRAGSHAHVFDDRFAGKPFWLLNAEVYSICL